MKTFNKLLTSAILASVATIAQADNPISSMTYEELQNMFTESTYQDSSQVGILSYGDDHNNNSVWSTEYEQYVNPAHFDSSELASTNDINQYMDSNPTAAGRMKGRETFIYNELAGEYHLQ